MEQNVKLTIPKMLEKLDNLYVEENKLKKEIKSAIVKLEQLQENIDLLEHVIMHQSNRMSRNGVLE